MASLQQEPTGVFHVVIRINGKRYKRSLGTKTESKAIARRDEIEENTSLVQRGKIVVPEGVRAIDFVMNDCKEPSTIAPCPHKTPSSRFTEQTPTNTVSLKSVFERFFDAIPPGNIEDDTLRMMHIHKRHLFRVLKPTLSFATLTGENLQSYVNKRAKEKTQYIANRSNGKKTRKPVGATTIRKEITTLGAAWRWAKTVPLVIGDFPNGGLRFPKIDEKPPFQTWAEIERQIEVGQLDAYAANELWECLYLRKEEVAALLDHVTQVANHGFIYPMFAMAAFTGARRSELLRSRKADFDFEQNFVTIREKKRVKGRRSTRRVPLTDELRKIMLNWLECDQLGGTATFVHKGVHAINPITRDQAQSHFRQTLKGSKWSKIKGWHCLRHSFISNLACAGIDQRIIDDFVGHTTEDMRRRYRHLFPDVKQAAINRVFG